MKKFSFFTAASIFVLFSLTIGIGAYSYYRHAITSEQLDGQDLHAVSKPTTSSKDGLVAATSAPTPVLIPSTLPVETTAPTRNQVRKHSFVPTLEYHHIRDFTDLKDRVGYYGSVSPALFEQQMKTLSEAQYRSITPSDYSARGNDKKAFLITFDDGYDNAYSAAFPILKKYNFTATFYVISEFIGTPGYLTKPQIKEMQDAGMIIGSHTLNHVDLTKVPVNVASDQIKTSKHRLEDLLGTSINDFCYPFGGHSPVTVQLVRDAGYTTAVTTDPPSATGSDDLLLIPRIAITNQVSVPKLLARMRTASSY